MLRLLVLVLVMANVAYFAWSRGHLSGLVSVAPDQREPQRLAQQVRPEVVRLLPPGSAATPADTPASSQ